MNTKRTPGTLTIGEEQYRAEDSHYATWLPLLAGDVTIARIGYEDSRHGSRFCDEAADDREANAAFIVHTCNLHDDLVKALKAARDHICDKMAAHKTDTSELVDVIDSVLERARQNFRNRP